MQILFLCVLSFALIGIIIPSAFAADGDITAVLSQSEGTHFDYNQSQNEYNSLVQVDSDTYALAYTGTDTDGFITTFDISHDGTSITLVEKIEHDATHSTNSALVKGESNLFVLAYDSSDKDSHISTFTIDDDGDITPILVHNHAAFASASANLEYEEFNHADNSIVHVDSDIYAVAFMSHGYDGHIRTFSIPSDGSSITELDVT